MAEGRLAGAVRQQVGLGRILPLGGPADGVWIAESAAAPVLRQAAEAVGGVRVRSLRIGLGGEPTRPGGPAGTEGAAGAAEAARPGVAAVPAPASALPYGPLRVDASFEATADRPLPATAELVRAAVAEAADTLLGLPVTTVDLEVSGLLEDAGEGSGGAGPRVAPPERTAEGAAGTGPSHAAARAARDVPGVARLDPGASAVLAGSAGPGAPGIRLEDTTQPPRRHVQTRIAVLAGRRVLDVALEVRTAVAAAVSADAPGPVTVAVFVTAIEG